MNEQKDFIDNKIDDLGELAKKKLDSFQIAGFVRRNTVIGFYNSEINKSTSQNTSHLYLTAIKDQKVKTVELALVDQESWKTVMETLVTQLTKATAGYRHPGFPKAKYSVDVPPVKDPELLLEETSQEKKAGLVEQVVNTIEITEKTARASGSFETFEVYFRVMNSCGIDASDETGYHHLKMTAKTRGGKGTGDEERYFKQLKELAFEELAVRATMDSLADTMAKKGESGQFPVVLAPMATQQLIRITAAIFNGYYHAQESACLPHLEGEALFDEQLNLVDDPLSSMTVFNITIDGEGVAKHFYPLIDKGIPVGILHDMNTASNAGVETSGHKNYPFMNHYHPGPAAYNLVLKDGNSDFEEMLSETKEGILIKGFNDLNIEPLTGKISGFTSKGVFSIRNGEIDQPLKEYRVDGEILTVLKNIPLIGTVEEKGLFSGPYVKLGQLRLENV
ncbi:MAG: TldD/PmbA family protein [Candidatus Odinarchaeota archaeon]